LSPRCEEGRQKHGRRNHGSALEVGAAAGGRRNKRQQLLKGWLAGLHRRFGGGRRWKQQSPFRRGREEADCRGERERRVLTAEGSDTKLRIIGRLNLLDSQPFLYVCVCVCRAIYNSNDGVVTQENDYNISFSYIIDTLITN
jgi:hypothetical protein